MLEQDNEDDTERLSLRLPKGLKEDWKKKAKDRNFSYVWTYLKFLVDNDITGQEFSPENQKVLENLIAENRLLKEKVDLLLEKMVVLEKITMNKAILTKLISDRHQEKVMNALGPGKKLGEIAAILEIDEITILGALDVLESKGKVRLNIDNGTWERIE